MYSRIKFMTILPLGTEWSHADRRTERPTHRHGESNSNFSQFCAFA